MLCTSVLDFVRVEASQGAQLLELVCRSYSEFGQVMTLAEEQAVLEIASGEPLAKAWLIGCKGELIGYFILALTFSLRCRGRGAVLDQIYLTPELRTQRVLCRVIEFVEYQAALVTCPRNNLSYKPAIAASQALLILRNTSVPLARHT